MLRRSEKKDIDRIMEIIDGAKSYLKENMVDQWQNGYPNHEAIESDIEKNWSYVYEEDDLVLGTTALSFDGEETYEKIYEGAWISDIDYGVIHRVGVDNSMMGKSIGSKILEEVDRICIQKGIYSIKVDTHEDNMAMQRLLDKNGYKYCGVIYLKDGNKRLAFEKILY